MLFVFTRYRGDGEGLVQDAVVDELLVDVARRLAHPLQQMCLLVHHYYLVIYLFLEKTCRDYANG